VRALTYLPCMFLRAFVFTLPRASLMAASASSSSYLKQNTMRVKGVTDSLEVERGRERGRDTRRHREIVRECGSGTGRGCDVICKIEWKGNISQGCVQVRNRQKHTLGTDTLTYLFNRLSEQAVLATKGSCTFPPSDTYLFSGTADPGGGWGTIPVLPRDRALPVAWGKGTLKDPVPEVPSDSDICLVYCLLILSAHTSSRRTLGGLFGCASLLLNSALIRRRVSNSKNYMGSVCMEMCEEGFSIVK
jgi:hypothetical protein